jgi:hypothetical protein
MHQLRESELSEADLVKLRLTRIESVLAENGIAIRRADPLILGRQPHGTPAIAATITKQESGCWLRLFSKDQSADDVSIASFEVEISIVNAMLDLKGWLELSDDSLMHPQIAWSRGSTDAQAQLEQGDRVNLRFNGTDWSTDAVVTSIHDQYINFIGHNSFPMAEPKAINSYNEYRESEKLLDPLTRQELQVESTILSAKKRIRGWRNGRPGKNSAFNGMTSDLDGRASGLFRTIELWASSYENLSGNVTMTVELPVRRQF